MHSLNALLRRNGCPRRRLSKKETSPLASLSIRVSVISDLKNSEIPMTIDSLTVTKIAHLARLKIPPSEAESLIKDLNRILEWVEQLDEVNTENVEPMFSINLQQMRRRPDQVTDGNYAEAIVANAPESEFNMFAVPKVVE